MATSNQNPGSTPIARLHDKAREYNDKAEQASKPGIYYNHGDFALYMLISNMYRIAAEVSLAIVSEMHNKGK